MKKLKPTYDVIVIGSGPGGLAAAIAAKKAGADDVLVLERDIELGGILLQCIHNGFGLETFKEDLPGPSYAQRFINEVHDLKVDVILDSMVLEATSDRRLFVTSKQGGIQELQARALVMAMGCRERTRAQVRLPGTRPAGVYTAGTAQRWVNVEGFMPGKRFVILGSGDIGMIMARRLTFEGAKVERVLEIMPYLSGLTRNYVQCLQDYGIPLQLQHTVKRIIGNQRVEAIEAVAVDNQWQPIPGSEEIIPCDTLLLSVGLIPENELSRQAGVRLDPVTGGPFVDNRFQTNVPGVFAAGNVVHVYDLVDWVTEAGYEAGKSAALFALGKLARPARLVPVSAGESVRYVVPHTIDPAALSEGSIALQMRVHQPIEAPVWVEAVAGEHQITRRALPYARPGEMVTLNLKPETADELRKTDKLVLNITKR
ncbi:MAG: FAD-dependent oxidoreductase [Kiritimatiellota bacterium]|nr:FAD-dependent oxidoreductase [Kiritimatiellota bacterium]